MTSSGDNQHSLEQIQEKGQIESIRRGLPMVEKLDAEALQQEKDTKYELTSMGTIMEGDLKKLLSLVMKMHETAFDGEIMRVVTTIRIDDRRDRSLTMSGKIKSLMKQLEH